MIIVLNCIYVVVKMVEKVLKMMIDLECFKWLVKKCRKENKYYFNIYKINYFLEKYNYYNCVGVSICGMKINLLSYY